MEKINSDITHNPLLMHEYGHYVQSQKIRPIYTLFIMPVSGISSLSKKTVEGTMPELRMHDIRWYEQWANRNAAKYFGIDWAQYDYPNNTYPTNFRH